MSPPSPMDEPRLKSHIRVAAHLRRASAAGAFATIARRGDDDAGAIIVKVFMGARAAKLFVQSRDINGAQIWRDPLDGATDESAIDAFIAKEAKFDRDIWVIEIEDREGRAFLEE